MFVGVYKIYKRGSRPHNTCCCAVCGLRFAGLTSMVYPYVTEKSRFILSSYPSLCLKELWKTMDKVSGCSWLHGWKYKSAVLELSQCIWQCSQHFVYDITTSDMHCSIFSEEEITGSTGKMEEDSLWGIPQRSENFACAASLSKLSSCQFISLSQSIRSRRLCWDDTSGTCLKY